MQVQIQDLSKTYGGGVRALRDINLTIHQGMFGLLGPNGAGKTTLMRIMATLLPASTGDILVDGVSVHRQPHVIRCVLGYLPQSFNAYPQLTVKEFLDYMALLSGLDAQQRATRVTAVLLQANLMEQQGRRTHQLSGGMTRRLGIAQALLNEPRLLIVDEPTAGLDPAERVRFRNLLASLSGDRVVLLSTHIVEDVASTCSHVAVLHEGCLRFQGTPAQLTQVAAGQVWTLAATQEQWQAFQQRYRVLGAVRENGAWQVRLLAEEPPASDAMLVAPTIEDGYMYLMEGAQAR